MQDLDELKHVFLICAEFVIEVKKSSVSSFFKENNFKPCLTKQLLNMFKFWCEWGISLISNHSTDSLVCFVAKKYCSFSRGASLLSGLQWKRSFMAHIQQRVMCEYLYPKLTLYKQ